MRSTADVDLRDSLLSVRRLLLEVAEELGPRQALAALNVQRMQLDSDDGEGTGPFVEMEHSLHKRQTFLDSLVPEIEGVDCIEMDEPPPPKSRLRLVWRNPALA